MAGIATTIFTNTAEKVATEYASPYVRYFFHFGKIIEDFKDQRNQLELKKDRVKNAVDEAIRQVEVIEKDVQDWLTRAEKELREAQDLEDEVERNKCFTWCPNWGWRICLSKKVAKNTLLISKLLSSDFSRVSYRAPPEGLEFLISKDFMPSKSSKEAFDGIMKALTRDGVHIIGLYGMPGVGKTTLAEEVGKQAKERELLDKVIIVTVSQNPDINKIQDKIAASLGLNFTTKEGKAEVLWQRLKGEKTILIIVDDIWKYYDDDYNTWDQLKLKYIGIPFGDQHQGCKILLTTRSEEVCTQMNCQEKIPLNLLNEDEAWTLFRHNASLENPSPTLIGVAKEVARECKGLPLAIKTVGRALKDKTQNEWEVVNQRFKDSRHLENQEVSGGIYRSLLISYDYLKGHNHQSCLLLCSLFPEDYEIRIEDLTLIGIGQGMFDNVNLIEDARREMHVITTKLQESGLLLETGGVRTVKMHDVVRDFVHWMTVTGERDQNMFYVRSGLKIWPRQSLQYYTAISLINSEINNFPDRFEFLKLKVFLLEVQRYTRVPSTFFEGMKALKVVFLHGVELSHDGLQFLPNLRTLSLKFCELENARCLGNLQKLEVLIIENCKIKQRGYKLTGLTTLRSLAISCNTPSKVFILPSYWLSSLVGLEELCLGLDVEWAISEESANKFSLSELSSLPLLTHLSLQVGSKCIPQQFVFPPFWSYYIVVNVTDYRRIMNRYENCRCLTIRGFSLNPFKKLFCNVEVLRVEECERVQVIFQKANQEIQMPPESSLKRLYLESLPELRNIWEGPTHHVSLQNLKVVKIRSCNKLTSVFSLSLAQTLLQLEELEIRSCGELEHIISTEPGIDDHGIVPNTLLHPQICWPKFKTLKIHSCAQLEYVFPFTLAQGLQHLECIEIAYSPRLKQVFGNMAEERDNGQYILLPQLQFLALINLQNLCSLCPRNYFVIAPSLKNFEVLNCPKYTHFPTDLDTALQAQSEDFLCAYKDMILCSKNLTLDRTNKCRNLILDVDREGLNGLVFLKLHNCSYVDCLYETTDHMQPTIAFSNLVELVIEEMIGLKMLCNSQPPKGFLQKLEKLRITSCMNLASLSPVGQNLKEVMIESCGQLREIFQVDEVLHNMEANQALVLMSNLTSLELKQLSELRCIWKGPTNHVSLQNLKVAIVSSCNRLTSVFSVSLAQTLPYLEHLEILDCNGLEQVFGNMAEETDNGQHIRLPQLQFLALKNLQNLCSLCPRNYFVILQSLKYLEVLNCPKYTHFSIDLDVARQAQSKDFLYAYKDMISCSKNLTLDRTNGCRNLIPDVDREGLNGLVFLELHNCSNVECLYETTEHRQSTIAFSNTVELVIEEMIDLKMLCNSRPPKGFLQKLEKLKITNCMNLASLSPVGQNLKEVMIESCGQLQEIFQVDEVLHNMEANQAPVLMSNLTSLELKQLSELRCIWKGPTNHVSLQNLKVAIVSSCNKLTSLFSISLAQTLLYLEHLEILDCNGLEQVFCNMVDESDNGQDIRLPQLQFLALKNLQNLCSLCPKNYFVILPSLKNFEVVNCPKYTYFPIELDVALQAQSKDFLYASKDMICCSKNITLDRSSGCRNLILDVDQEGFAFLQLHNFSNLECLYETTDHRQPTIAFSNLVELVIEEMIGFKKFCNSRPPKGFLQKLEKLKITNCMNLDSLSPVGQNLKEVMIEFCGQLQEIFQVDEILHNMEANQAEILSNLTSLELKQLSELRYIWKGTSHSVINLQSLKIVKISNCNRLRYLFSPSLAKSLVQLEELILHDLPELEQLITELESDAEQEQENVDEQRKPFLPLMLPSLKCFEVSRCPRLAPFVIQPDVDNQAQIKGLCLSNQQCNSFEILLRQSLPNLEHGIVGNCFQFLQWLTISNCNKLKYLFSPILAQSLRHLEFLLVNQCEELQQIVDKDETSASSSQGLVQPICFPRLNELYIEECNNLKWLFSVSVALSLPQLQRFRIRGASEMVQVFEYEGGIGNEDIEKEIVLPELDELSLKELPRLKSFIPMGYHFSFPKLVSLEVEECPNLTTSFSTDSNDTIHARTKAAGDAPMEGSAANVDVTEVSNTNGETAWPVGTYINWRRH